jgi:hypothetical protein
MSDVSVASSTISELLEHKVKACEADMEYVTCYQEGLREVLAARNINQNDYNKEVETLDKKYLPVMEELQVLKNQRRILEDDIEDEYKAENKRLKAMKEGNEPDIALIERAYSSVMVSKVMSASAKQKKKRFDQSKFRRDVLSYYHASRDMDGSRQAYCHLTGWQDRENIKAAHLVPKSLHGDELSFLFGARNLVLSDCKNDKEITIHQHTVLD